MNANDEWHKALVLVMRKLGIVEILITKEDMVAVNAIQRDDARPCAVTFSADDGVHVRLTTPGEMKLAEAEAPRIATLN